VDRATTSGTERRYVRRTSRLAPRSHRTAGAPRPGNSRVVAESKSVDFATLKHRRTDADGNWPGERLIRSRHFNPPERTEYGPIQFSAASSARPVQRGQFRTEGTVAGKVCVRARLGPVARFDTGANRPRSDLAIFRVAGDQRFFVAAGCECSPAASSSRGRCLAEIESLTDQVASGHN
jgi:hypothetical protein